MADPITVEFELDADQVSRALGLRSDQVFSYGTAVVMLAGSAVCYLLYDGGHRPKMWIPALLLLGYAAVSLFYAAVHLPRRRRASARRLVGEARIKFADDGVRYSSASTAKGFSWPKVDTVLDTPEAWVLTAGKRNGEYVVPKAAVPPEQAEGLTAQLREWSGKSYKLRKR
ncbi:MAG TPA: YcxB family protein [Actinospica sp.]|nr:YcxB family protein [Actinospica sp.]